jgi:hypothetical protein
MFHDKTLIRLMTKILKNILNILKHKNTMKQTLTCILKYNFISLNSLHSVKINLRKKSINYYVEKYLELCHCKIDIINA